MTDPVTLGAIAFNLGCGLMTNGVHAAGLGAMSRVADWWKEGQPPENHDVLQATHAAYVAAMGDMASAASAAAFTDAEMAAASALTALVEKENFKAFRWDGEHLPLAETTQRIEALFAGRQGPANDDAVWTDYNRVIVGDLAVWGVDLPDRLAILFVEGLETSPPWHVAFRARFAEAIKTDREKEPGARAFRILTFERLNELTAAGVVLADAVGGLYEKIDSLQAGQIADRARDEDFQERVLAMLEAKEADAQARGVTDAALRALAERVAENVPDAAQALIELGKAIDDLIRLREAAAHGTNLGELVDEVLRRMAAANEKGCLDEAAQLGAQAFADWQEQQAAQRQAGLRLVWANIEQERLRYNAEAVARWIYERLVFAGPDRPTIGQLHLEQYFLQHNGATQGNLFDLDVAIELAQISIEKASNEQDRALSLNDLGTALWERSEHSSDEASLALSARAIEAFEAALKVRTRDAHPRDWASTQNSLANALQKRARRIEGDDSLALLARAVAAYRAVLDMLVDKSDLVERAMVLNNLSNALVEQAIRSERKAALALLKHAVTAYELSLEIYAREEMPVKWAMAKNNIAHAYVRWGTLLGEKAGLKRLALAITAFDAALEIRSFDAMPAEWAGTQLNVAITHLNQSVRSNGEDARSYAVAAREACERALLVFTRDQMAYDHQRAVEVFETITARLAELGGQQAEAIVH